MALSIAAKLVAGTDKNDVLNEAEKIAIDEHQDWENGEVTYTFEDGSWVIQSADEITHGEYEA